MTQPDFQQKLDHIRARREARQADNQPVDLELGRPRNDVDFHGKWADDAYEKIRATDNDVAAIAKTVEGKGLSAEDVKTVKDHVFREEHLLDRHGEGRMGRFDADPRMAEAWDRLAKGEPHPADFDLLKHELAEAKHMKSTGDPSYQAAHTAALRSGYTWDDGAAARDGIGYQLKH